MKVINAPRVLFSRASKLVSEETASSNIYSVISLFKTISSKMCQAKRFIKMKRKELRRYSKNSIKSWMKLYRRKITTIRMVSYLLLSF